MDTPLSAARQVGRSTSEQAETKHGSLGAELETHEVQALADQIDALREATAGHHFRIRVKVEIGEGGKVDQAVLDKVNCVLGQVKAGWHTQ